MRQTRGEEIEKCLDGGLEPTYCFSNFILLFLACQHIQHVETEVNKCQHAKLTNLTYLSN